MKARTANYPDLVQEAEKAVQGVKDAELKRIAFQKVLEELLSGGGAEKRSTSKRARSGKPSRANDTPRGGPKAYIIELIDEGYFKKPKGMADLKVELENRGAESALVVADHGPGIPSADRDRVTQRFVRLESSRNSPGTGLGLSLVAAVARLHEATLSFEDNHPGLRATLAFHRIGDEPRRTPAAQQEIRAQPEPVH